MYAQVKKSNKENKGRAIANAVIQNKGSVRQGFGFVDNRPAAKDQKNLQLMMNGKQRSATSKAIQKMAVMAVKDMDAQEDALVWNNIEYAVSKATAPIGDLEKNKVWDQLKDKEEIRIVEHGEVQKVGGIGAATILDSMFKDPKKIPVDKKIGGITFQSCYAGVVGGTGSSLVSDMKVGLQNLAAQVTGVPVKGRTGIAFGFKGLGEATAKTSTGKYKWTSKTAKKKYIKEVNDPEDGYQAYCEVMYKLQKKKTKISKQKIFETPFDFRDLYREPWDLIGETKKDWDKMSATERSTRVAADMEDYWKQVNKRMVKYGGFKAVKAEITEIS
jgi:hypothetical protein